MHIEDPECYMQLLLQADQVHATTLGIVILRLYPPQFQIKIIDLEAAKSKTTKQSNRQADEDMRH